MRNLASHKHRQKAQKQLAQEAIPIVLWYPRLVTR